MRTLIRRVAVFDGIGAARQSRMAAVIDGDQIVWVGRQEDSPSDADETVDGEGLTLVPGLIDCHTHLMMGYRSEPGSGTAGVDEEVWRHGVANAQRSLDAGVTAARDLGWRTAAVVDLARAVERGEVSGPEIVAAARFIAPRGGYIAGMAREVDSVEDARRAAEEQVRDGARVLKAIASPVPPRSGERPVSDSFGVDALRAVAEVAHAAGLKVTVHAHGLAGARDAVAAGVDCIEHGYRLDGVTIGAMAEKGTWLVPTMVAMEAAQAPNWAPGSPDEAARRARERWEAAIDAVRTTHRAGVRIATGTDSFGIVPIEALHREISLLVSLGGLTPTEALRAATSAAASLIGIDDRTGTIAGGMRADLVLVEGDPTADPECLGRIRGVWRRGVRVR
jgi:imidazolonepropionase-like amidohydrolase